MATFKTALLTLTTIICTLTTIACGGMDPAEFGTLAQAEGQETQVAVGFSKGSLFRGVMHLPIGPQTVGQPFTVTGWVEGSNGYYAIGKVDEDDPNSNTHAVMASARYNYSGALRTAYGLLPDSPDLAFPWNQWELRGTEIEQHTIQIACTRTGSMRVTWLVSVNYTPEYYIVETNELEVKGTSLSGEAYLVTGHVECVAAQPQGTPKSCATPKTVDDKTVDDKPAGTKAIGASAAQPDEDAQDAE